ncbi:Translin [Vararia minispora EC-137]|uniref:Translin n=1 Tax=Vararia minispora EC-137 TaxID=1314806 RepID=A0ACB8QTE2_9AGAM|nr:Translin [Vararia minispora EC-137]
MSIQRAFLSFRDALDDHNDRRERLIKTSRDITAASKKVVFLLHRLAADAPAGPDTAVASVAYPKLREIQAAFAALRPELAGDAFWRYQHAVSPGLQEYIEALSFAHYLEHRTLIPFDDVQASLSDADGPFFPLTVADYLLGLSDLTGELMRFAISSISRRGGRTVASDVSTFVRACKADFEGFTPYVRELAKKQAVTAQSLLKIEDAAYAIVLRTSEYDLPPELLDDLVARTVADAGAPGSFARRHQEYERVRDEDAEVAYEQ